MNFLFRVDSSARIGSGHLMRCLTLARLLRQQGAKVGFLCRDLLGNLARKVEGEGFHLHLLPRRDRMTSESRLAHASWLETSWEQDAKDCSEFIGIGEDAPDWLIVDHYALDERWERAMRPHVGSLMVIDDLADRRHDCDILLDQNLVLGMQDRYRDLVPPHCHLLLGPKYALLGDEYRQLRPTVRARDGEIGEVFVSFGGVGAELTVMALQALRAIDHSDLSVIAVSPADLPDDVLVGWDRLIHHSQLPSLAPLMATADLAVGAAGTTSWERLCLGLPAAVVTMAENQKPIAEGLQDAGLIHLVGDSEELKQEGLRTALRRIIEAGSDREMSERCLAAVDGLGTERCLELLLPPRDLSIEMRDAGDEDEGLLLSWANDPETRAGSFQKGLIDLATHRPWLACRLNSDWCRIFVAQTALGTPLGQVRFESEDEGRWRLHYSLSRLFRGRGLGRNLLEIAIDRLIDELGEVELVASALEDNIASQKTLEALGFKAVGEGDGAICYQRA